MNYARGWCSYWKVVHLSHLSNCLRNTNKFCGGAMRTAPKRCFAQVAFVVVLNRDIPQSCISRSWAIARNLRCSGECIELRPISFIHTSSLDKICTRRSTITRQYVREHDEHCRTASPGDERSSIYSSPVQAQSSSDRRFRRKSFLGMCTTVTEKLHRLTYS